MNLTLLVTNFYQANTKEVITRKFLQKKTLLIIDPESKARPLDINKYFLLAINGVVKTRFAALAKYILLPLVIIIYDIF